MEDNPDFLEHGRRRFDSDEPPPPHSSGGGTELPSPDIVRTRTEVDELINQALDAEERYWLRECFWSLSPL